MTAYTISQLANMAGVSVRTLHHYDHVGLLRPSMRTEAGYRLYDEPDLLRLQQILFFKELDLPLEEIRQILDDPQFDLIQALAQHRELLHRRMERLQSLLRTIDRTIQRLTKEDADMPDHELTDEELYEGFDRETVERWNREAREMYDPEIMAESNRKVRKMTKQQWQAVKDEGHAITQSLAALADRAPDDPDVQAWIERHHAWIENFYRCGADIYRGLADLYTQHPEFRATYDKYGQDLADFIAAAMRVYADRLTY